MLDTLGWRYTLVGARPPFLRLLAARCAGQAVNVVTALGGLGGEAIKAWLIRRDISYEASVPSLILAKTAEVVGQALLLVTGILVAWATGIVGWSLLGPMCYLLIIEVIGVSGFIVAQVTGGVGRVGRLLAWAGVGRGAHRIDAPPMPSRGGERSRGRLNHRGDDHCAHTARMRVAADEQSLWSLDVAASSSGEKRPQDYRAQPRR